MAPMAVVTTLLFWHVCFAFAHSFSVSSVSFIPSPPHCPTYHPRSGFGSAYMGPVSRDPSLPPPFAATFAPGGVTAAQANQYAVAASLLDEVQRAIEAGRSLAEVLTEMLLSRWVRCCRCWFSCCSCC